MDVTNKDFGFQVEEMVPVEQTFSAKPEKFMSSYIKFGNSGFRIRFGNDGVNNFDFTPENNYLAIEGKGGKYALMLGSSLLELHTLLNSQEKMHELGIKNPDLHEMSALTNTVFIDALKKLFSKSETKDIVTDEGTGVITINFSKFKNLDVSDPLIKYLERTSKMTEGMKVLYWESKRK